METKHIPALDGIRGIAILLVLMVHFIPPVAMQWRVAEWFMKVFATGGWVGVDLFFVLSGFLITGILLRTKDRPRYFVNFYMRRTLRIFPLYFLALLIVFGALPHFIDTPRFATLQEHQYFHWLYLTNVGLLAAGKEAMDSDVATLAVYWSLAVEEHFYLVWPTVIYFCRTRTVKIVCAAVIASAFLIRSGGVLALGSTSMFAYQTPARMDGLAVGALVATLLYERGTIGLRQLLRPIAIIAAIAGTVLLAHFLYMKGLWASHWFMRTFGLSMLLGIFAAVLIASVSVPNGALSRVLSSSTLRFFGKYSYGMYVIHALLIPALLTLLPREQWMGFFGDQVMIGSLSLVAAKIAICTVLAVVSFHFYEMPFLRLKRSFESKPHATSTEAVPQQLAVSRTPDR